MGEEPEVIASPETSEPTPDILPDEVAEAITEPEPEPVSFVGPRGEDVPLDCIRKED